MFGQGKFQVASRLRNIFCLNSASLKSILVAKIVSPVVFDTDHSFKRLNALFLTKNLFIEVFMMRRSRLVIFLLQGKVLCFARVIKSLGDVYLSEVFGAPCRKNFISGSF